MEEERFQLHHKQISILSYCWPDGKEEHVLCGLLLQQETSDQVPMLWLCEK